MDAITKVGLGILTGGLFFVGYQMIRDGEMAPRGGMTETVTKEASGCGCNNKYDNGEV